MTHSGSMSSPVTLFNSTSTAAAVSVCESALAECRCLSLFSSSLPSSSQFTPLWAASVNSSDGHDWTQLELCGGGVAGLMAVDQTDTTVVRCNWKHVSRATAVGWHEWHAAVHFHWIWSLLTQSADLNGEISGVIYTEHCIFIAWRGRDARVAT